MKKSDADRLFASANLIVLLGTVTVLIAAQWNHAAMPLGFLLAILALTAIKCRLIVLDFLGLRTAAAWKAIPLYAFIASMLGLNLANLAHF